MPRTQNDAFRLVNADRFVRLPLLATTAACALALPHAAAAQVSAPALTTKTYAPSTENIANPKRGFFHQDLECADHPLDVDELRTARKTERITLLRCVFYLDEFKDRADQR